MLHPKSCIENLTAWETKQITRVASLTDEEILGELEAIMQGQNYPWLSVSQRLQSQLDNNTIKLEHFETDNIVYEWNVLCDERLSWNSHGGPSFRSFRFNRACLANLVILPTQTGLAAAGKLREDERKMSCAHTHIGTCVTDIDTKFWGSRLAVEPAGMTGGRLRREEFRGSDGYYYAEGPEFRVEYIHDRVEF